MCNLTFELIFEDHQESIHTYSGGDKTITYGNNKDLLDFSLENLTRQIHSHNHKLTLKLHLKAKPDYHLINSFLPSSLLFFVCYSSLSFPTTYFNERIMVSLTSLLVVVTLFSQATDTYIKTPYYKLIDVWYVMLITLCFATVTANVLVNSLRLSRVTTQTGLMKKVLAARLCNTACQVLLLISYVILFVTFVLFGLDIL